MTLGNLDPTLFTLSGSAGETYVTLPGLDGATSADTDPYADPVLTDTAAPAADGALPSVADAANLTPDALMAYCQARLDSIDGQVQGVFNQQELRNSESSALQSVLQTFQQYTSGVNNDPSTCTTLETSLYDLITQIQAQDPGCPELGKLSQTYNDLLYSGTGPTSALPYVDGYTPVQNGPLGDNTLGATEIQGYISNLQGCGSDLDSGSELQMIQLQSLMSQRETAVELTTNLVQSLGDQAEKIAENVGH